MNKFDYEKSGYTEPTEEDEKRIFTEEFPVKEVFTKKVLMTTGREFNELYKTLPEGIHYFAIRGCDSDPDKPATVEDKVIVNRCGSLLAKEDIIAADRAKAKAAGISDIYRDLTDKERRDMYDMLWDCENQHDAPEEQEWMTISDFIHKDDQEFDVCIEEIIHHNVKIKAKDAEEAAILAAKKYIYDENYCQTTTETGSIDEVFLSVAEKFGEFGEFGEYKDLYGYANDKINGKTVL